MQGTPFFTPFEIINQRHLLNFVRGEVNPAASMAAQLNLREESPEYARYKIFSRFGTRTKSIPLSFTENTPEKKTVVRYNFQHDLESIWWIALYFITALVNYEVSQTYSRQVFRHTLEAADLGMRHNVLLWRSELDDSAPNTRGTIF